MLSGILLLGRWVGNSRGDARACFLSRGFRQFRDELSAEVSKVRHISAGHTNIWSRISAFFLVFPS